MVIHSDKLRWLLWLRWKILSHRFTRAGKGNAILGTVLVLIFSLLIGGGIAIGTFFAYRLVPAPLNSEILFLVLTGIYLLWIFFPLLQVSTNEGLDVSKLIQFPLTSGELMASLLLSTVLDTTTIMVMLIFAAVVAGWAFSLPLALIALLTVVVFYAQLIGMSQLIMALLSRTLQSRRLRDLSAIAITVIIAVYYVIYFTFLGGHGGGFIGILTHGSLSSYLQWLPPGMAARAIQQASVGHWGMSFVWLAALLVLTVVVLYLWQYVVARGLTAPENNGTQRVRRRRVERMPASEVAIPSGVQAAHATRAENSLLTQVLAIAGKELKYFRRDPLFLRFMIAVIAPLFYVIFVVSTSGSGSNGSNDLISQFQLLFLPAIVLFALYTLSFNTLGFERQSLTTLLLFPINPKRILWGKNLVVFAIGTVELLIVVVVLGFMSHSWAYTLPSLALCLAGMGIILGYGNFTSVFLPQRMAQGRRGFQTYASMSTGGGCLRVVMSMVAMLLTLLTLLPVGFAMIVPIIFHMQWFWAVAIPFSLVYGALFYYIVTALVAPRILTRAPEILAVVARE